MPAVPKTDSGVPFVDHTMTVTCLLVCVLSFKRILTPAVLETCARAQRGAYCNRTGSRSAHPPIDVYTIQSWSCPLANSRVLSAALSRVSNFA